MEQLDVGSYLRELRVADSPCHWFKTGMPCRQNTCTGGSIVFSLGFAQPLKRFLFFRIGFDVGLLYPVALMLQLRVPVVGVLSCSRM